MQLQGCPSLKFDSDHSYGVVRLFGMRISLRAERKAPPQDNAGAASAAVIAISAPKRGSDVGVASEPCAVPHGSRFTELLLAVPASQPNAGSNW